MTYLEGHIEDGTHVKVEGNPTPYGNPQRSFHRPADSGTAVPPRSGPSAEAREKAEPGRGMPMYSVVMADFFRVMCAEMEANFYKGDPEPYRKCDMPTAMGEIFYHTLKLAWLAKHEPENKTALAEFTADVANCAFIAFANLEAEVGVDNQDLATLIAGIGDPDEFQSAFDELIEWIVKHFGWSREDMCFGRSD